MQSYYRVGGAAGPTTAAQARVALTAATIKTVIQLLHPSLPISVIEWGVSFDNTAVGVPVECELIHTTTVAATVTAYVANDVGLYTAPTASVPGLTLSTSGSGYNASAEGTVVAPVRIGDHQQVPPTGGYVKQFPLGQEFEVPAAGVLRVRLTAPAAVNALPYVIFGIG
jgi:hypothetical protein